MSAQYQLFDPTGTCDLVFAVTSLRESPLPAVRSRWSELKALLVERGEVKAPAFVERNQVIVVCPPDCPALSAFCYINKESASIHVPEQWYLLGETALDISALVEVLVWVGAALGVMGARTAKIYRECDDSLAVGPLAVEELKTAGYSLIPIILEAHVDSDSDLLDGEEEYKKALSRVNGVLERQNGEKLNGSGDASS